MSKNFTMTAVSLGAVAVAMLSLGAAGSASYAAKPNIKNYCERVCIDGDACIYSCSDVKPKRRKIKLPPTTTRPEPVPNIADWRDSVLYPSGGGGGTGGGGNR